MPSTVNALRAHLLFCLFILSNKIECFSQADPCLLPSVQIYIEPFYNNLQFITVKIHFVGVSFYLTLLTLSTPQGNPHYKE